MAIIQGDVIGGAAGFYPKEINQSLRFNDDDSAYLSWTPASAGNRKTWTFSTWVKRGNLGSEQIIFSAGDDAVGARAFFGFQGTSDALYGGFNDGSTWSYITTNALFRDASAWYHVVFYNDLTDSTSTDRLRIYVNGVRQSVSNTGTPPNADQVTNSTETHKICSIYSSSGYATGLDGYLAETHFIDGTAYDATAFGEFKNGVWIPKEFAGTYGTNGFYLPYRNDYTVEGFSATTYKGNGSTQYIGGVGFSPDLVWIKNRAGGTESHQIYDVIRGATVNLSSDNTGADNTNTTRLTSFDADGFSLGSGAGVNTNTYSYVAWCWDAGSGSPVSNTDGSITSTVKANPSRGFSIVSYTGTGSASTETVGHGLSSAPELVIIKNRTSVKNWSVSTNVIDGSWDDLYLNLTNAKADRTGTLSTSSTFSVLSGSVTNEASSGFVAYCFHSVSGYSKMGSYTGTGASGNAVTTGFKPAFVMIKATNSTAYGSWRIFDGVRFDDTLYPNLSDAEYNGHEITFTDTGFTVDATYSGINASGDSLIYMAFADTREAAFWLDQSGNNNDWENNGLTESDISLDSPTNNFATLNVLEATASAFTEGNLVMTTPVSGNGAARANFAVSEGQWYWEQVCTYNDVGGLSMMAGVISSDIPYADAIYSSGYVYYPSGNKITLGTSTAYGSSYAIGDVIGIALDMDAGTCTYYKNGVSQGVAFTGLSGSFTAFAQDGSGGRSDTYRFNFGQDSSFAGNKTPQGYTDANGKGDFYYAPPTGYLALCTANLPEPAISPANGASPQDYFNTVLYTGDGTSSHAITGVGFQPDLVWVKARSFAESNGLFDSVRGVRAGIFTDTTNQESTWSSGMSLDSFDTDGFTAGYFGFINASGQSYASWNWKADNTSGSSNTDGSITSTVSANPTAGFSIVSWTGDGTSSNVGHGLNDAPQIVIIKDRDTTNNWYFAHTLVDGTNDIMYLNLTDANGTLSGSVPTSSVFYVEGGRNASGNDQIAYCFHSVPGYSSFGSYTGNGSSDGPFVYTGFRPAFVMIKRTDGVTNWTMHDDMRDGYNVDNDSLYANLSLAEDKNLMIDLLSNGFKLRKLDTVINASGGTYIYMAFAENPFKYSNAR